ncbi:unnamed protein product [Prorocentrum cordatum]|uniref:Alpha-1,4-N-acetylglucosaminyltransferase n=1 Tax=Prorocentrum cordatum TaxID=2364126 RepID=A0ABN9X4N5_9DINO|nr:unnamed protein product [Polarella glacialis]
MQPIVTLVCGCVKPRMHVWVMWDFPNGVPTTYRLNVRSWLRHANAEQFDLHLVNSTSIRDWLPDLPVEYDMLYQQAKSDFLRAAMLATYGGVYMDGDMILNEDLEIVFKELLSGEAEVMPYLFGAQACRKSFSTNFIAGSKGNRLSSGWYRRVLEKLNSTCRDWMKPGDNGASDGKNSYGCCYNPDGTRRKKCYISFGGIGDDSAHEVMREPGGQEVRVSCIPQDRGMAAEKNGCAGELLWKRLLPGPPAGFALGEGKRRPSIKAVGRRAQARQEVGGLLARARLRPGVHAVGHLPRLLRAGRLPPLQQHQLGLAEGVRDRGEALLQSESVVAEIYRRAVQGEQPRPDPRLAALFPHGIARWSIPAGKAAELARWSATS